MTIVLDNTKQSDVIKSNSLKAKMLQQKQRKQKIKIKKYLKNSMENFNISNQYNPSSAIGAHNKFIINKAAYDTAPKEFNVKKPGTDPLDSLLDFSGIANWDDVTDIHRTCLNSLLMLGEKIIELTKGVNAMEKNYFDDFNEFEKSLAILGKDMESISDKLADVKDSINGKTGPIATETELMTCYDAYNEFITVMGLIDNVLMPTIYNLSSAFQTAYDRYEAEQRGISVEDLRKEYGDDPNKKVNTGNRDFLNEKPEFIK